MWNETPEVVAVREALGLFSSTLLSVCPADGVVAGEKVKHSGILLVFDTLAVFDPNPNRKATRTLDGLGSDEGLCRWFADDTTSVLWNSFEKGLDINVAGQLSFRAMWVDDPGAVYNALTWVFDHDARRSGRELSLAALGALLYPDATRRLRVLSSSLDIDHGGMTAADALPSPAMEVSAGFSPASGSPDRTEFVVADIDGAIVTNKRLFFATSVVKLRDIKFMKLQKGSLIVVLSQYTRINIQCSFFRQALLLRKWLLSVLDGNSIKMANEQPRLLTMMALHRQFCTVDENSDGFLSKTEFANIVAPIFANDMFADSFFRVMDIDRSQEISFAEFAIGLMDLLDDNLEARIRFTFALFDVNGDGGIERGEMLNVLHSLQRTGDVISGVDDAELMRVSEELFTLLDANGDGTITMQEYMDGFMQPQVYSILCFLGLAGDRSLRRHRELSVALVSPNTPAWAIVSKVLHGVRIVVDQLFLSTATGDCFVASDAAGKRTQNQDLGAGVIVYRVDHFRALNATWDITSDTYEESLAVDNVAASLLLGSPRLPKLVGTTPPAMVSFDGRFTVFEIVETELEAFLKFIPEYASYMQRAPNSYLSWVSGVFTIVENDGSTRHVCVVRERTHVTAGFRFDLPSIEPPPVLTIDNGWLGIVIGQTASDTELAARFNLNTHIAITSAVAERDLAASETIAARTIRRDAARDAHRRAKKKQGGGCCGGSAVRDDEDIEYRDASGNLTAAQRPATMTRKEFADAQQRVAQELRPSPASHRALSNVTSNGHELRIQVTLFPTSDPAVNKHSISQTSSAAGWLTNASSAATSVPGGAAAANVAGNPIVEGLIRRLKEVDVDELPIPAAGQQCLSYDIVVFNGNPGRLTLDRSARLLYLESRSVLLFSVSLRMSYGLGFIRHKFPTSRNESKQLLIRSEPDATGQRFNLSKLVEFETQEELVQLASNVFRGMGQNNSSGLQTALIKIATVHWNVGGANPPSDLTPLFTNVDEKTGIVVVSATQCVFQSPGRAVTLSCEDDWSARVADALGPAFQIVHVSSCGATRIIIGCQSDVCPRISQLQNFRHSLVSEGGRAAGTAVAVSLMLENTPLAFIALELKAGSTTATNAIRLEETFRNISKALGYKADFLNSHFGTFLLGDFNFGTTMNATDAVRNACHENMAELNKMDMLTKERQRNGSLYLFDESTPIAFPPTGNFVRGVVSGDRRIYDEWHRHPPSWSSRILYRCLGHPADRATTLSYTSTSKIVTSTHNPVMAVYDVPVRQQYVIMNVLHHSTKCQRLHITDLRCKGLAAEDLNGTSDPVIEFVVPYAMDPTVDKTPVALATCDPVWNESFTVLLEGVEAPLLLSSYLAFVIVDQDTRGAGDPLGEAVVPLHTLDLSQGRYPKRSFELPVMRHGRCCGLLYCSLRLQTV